MSEEKGQSQREPDPITGSIPPAPNRFTWPFKRLYWATEKYLLWPIADSFKRMASWTRNHFSYRSPFAYIGVTLGFAITAGAIAAAVYFHNESKSTTPAPYVAQVPQADGTGAVTVPTTPLENPVAVPSAANDGNTLKGVAPSFETSADTPGGSGAGSANADSDPTLVKPAKAPKSGPLATAHNFAATFVEYEIGKKGAAKDFKQTATKKLAKALAVDPPSQPANGTVPKATVMNVVKGQTENGELGVSVALSRLGTSSELRLALTKDGEGKKSRWLVSEVRG